MQHKLSCGFVIVRKTETGWLTLLMRAFHHWDFPKGIREPGEEPMQAALREVQEETGIEDRHLGFFEGNEFAIDVGATVRHLPNLPLDTARRASITLFYRLP